VAEERPRVHGRFVAKEGANRVPTIHEADKNEKTKQRKDLTLHKAAE